MKCCKFCGDKLIININIRKTSISSSNYKCTKCEKRIDKERWTQKVKELYKDKKCDICGEENYLFLTFHHKTKGNKKYTISSCPKNKLNEELKKCVCLCHNHHWAFHKLYSNGNFPNWDLIRDEFIKKCEES